MSGVKDTLAKFDLCEILAYDAVDHLTADLSEHDKLYQRMAEKKLGRLARLSAASGAWAKAGSFDLISDHAPQLFPEIEHAEIETAVLGFAKAIGRSYVDHLFYDTIHANRQYRREKFPHPDGHNRCASQYIDYGWAPKYAAEFALAHELGLTKEVAQELTAGAEAIKG